MKPSASAWQASSDSASFQKCFTLPGFAFQRRLKHLHDSLPKFLFHQEVSDQGTRLSAERPRLK